MSNLSDLTEAMDVAAALADALIERGRARGQTAAELIRAVARFKANLETGFRKQTLGSAISMLFTRALAAGLPATIFRAVRETAEATAAVWPLAQWTRRSFRRQALIAEARRYQTVVFTDRDSVEAARSRLITAFDDLLEDASEVGEFAVMQDLNTLLNAVQRHLIETAIPLPEVVTYETPRPLPSLVLAHRLLTDASRRGELIGLNRVGHPLFMPATGKARSA